MRDACDWLSSGNLVELGNLGHLLSGKHSWQTMYLHKLESQKVFAQFTPVEQHALKCTLID